MVCWYAAATFLSLTSLRSTCCGRVSARGLLLIRHGLSSFQGIATWYRFPSKVLDSLTFFHADSSSEVNCRCSSSQSFLCVSFNSASIKVLLERDFYLIIKFEPYLEILPTFLKHTASENCFFSRSKLTG